MTLASLDPEESGFGAAVELGVFRKMEKDILAASAVMILRK